ncbi:hypothetical protein NA57DRAFT_46452 [Rhizodiscina lignyota]|uniref:Hemerythrin-like domain-containing protein n=1 Tax=Rhizodiscina lignyota TaxID=1504668 RepID=A0A9P4I822_9PEZI|nr:hypothetical protein NA57DRAFT_46452 [Rhizodiscina lignyota]
MTTNSPTEKPWADTPLAMIPTPVFVTKKHDMFTSGASHMCMVHNSILRGYNSIYHQAPHVAEADKADFIGYCLTWHKFLKSHADNEDTSLFVEMEKLLEDGAIFEESHKEHDAFMPGIAKFQEYLSSLGSPGEFSGVKLLEIMTAFQEPFEIHMRSEITTIANLAGHERAPVVGSAKEKSTQSTFDAREGKKLLMSGATDVMPFFLFNFDSSYEDGLWANWPPIPAPVRWGLINVAKFWHPGWWKFASCDAARRTIPLYAVPDSK